MKWQTHFEAQTLSMKDIGTGKKQKKVVLGLCV